jgi:UDP-N-acetylmuramoylalanine--D-glutamate ligase
MRARCGARNAAFLDSDDMLHVAFGDTDHLLGRADALQIEGEHNISNALAAASVAVALGADDAAIAAALATFSPLEHRVEPCGTVAGVRCYNDSKATNVDATVKALSAYLYASEATVRRDLNELERRGLVKRLHGGVMLLDGAARELPLYMREQQNIEAKRIIAAKAAHYLRD